MKTHNTKMKGKKALSMLLAVVMVLSVASPAMSPLMGIVAKAATGDPVELAFNNLFVFEKWATNANSTTVQDLIQAGTDGNGNPIYESKVDPDALVPDIQNGSFKFTKKVSEGVQSYTCYGGPDNNNFTYYMIDVKPNTSYTFHYNVQGDLWSFTPFVFYYDIEGKYIADEMDFYATPGYGNNHFAFTTPANAEYIQVRFTIGDNETSRGPNVGEATLPSSVYANVSDIAIFKTELYDAYFGAQEEELAAEKEALNLFELEAWASNERTHNPYTGTGSGSIVDITSNSFKLETTSSMFITGAAETTAANNLAHYTVDVNPSTTYSLIYSATENNLPSGSTVYCQNYIVELSSSGDVLGLIGPLYTGESDKNLEFTVGADTDRIQVAFMLINDVSPEYQYCVVEDVGLYETAALNSLPPIDYNVDYGTITGYPHRKVYTEGAGNYSELPTPTIPEGEVFAGWYTAEDGKGKLITADTEISYDSYTVYPKFETKLDDGGLKIDTLPTKLTYTLGEKVNTAGLVLEATVTTDGGTNVYKVNSGYRYSPETVATTPGTQTITVTYGGQSVSYDVNVVDSVTESVKVNGTATDVDVTNNEYTFNLTSDFNRYELTYYSNSYVKGTLNTVAADGTTVSEEFFLEPSTNGSFESFIDVFLDEEIYTNIATIKFEVLDKEFGTFELYSVDTILSGVPEDNMQYQNDGTHKVGIDLSMGGSLAYLEELSGNVVASYYGEGQEAQVDYKSMITGGTQITEGVNLINRHDPGRFVQQSYYGTKEDPYKIGDYNGVPWNYNPVQGGNYQFESSKIIDYRITDGEIYVKTRPLDWGKYSDEFANLKDGDYTDNNNNGQWDEGELVLDPIYGDDYITDSYMEAWYVFEDSMVKTYCRFVDYSGYPSNVTTQEMPAFYPIEPLNSFAYYDKDGLANDNDPNTNITPWADDNAAVYVDNPDFWGVSANYNTMLKENGKPIINPKVNSAENWAAFMGSNDERSFGIGIYSAGVTEFHYGTFPQIYKEPEVANGVLNTALTSTQFDHADMYENGVVTMPDMQDATSYIAPVDTMKFESYKPYNYSFYIASGTLNDIREDFKRAKTDDDAAAVANTNIAVPETAYMTPAEGKSKVGQYYVNNIINETSNSIETVADREDKMSFSVHIDEAKYFTVDITNVSNANDDIDLYKVSDNSEVSSSEKFNLNINTGTGVFDEGYYLAFNTTGLGYGEKATAKWTITGYDENNNAVGTYTAYTVLYASERTIGAVAEGRISSGSNNEISSWITGANGVDHSQRAPLGSLHGDNKSAGYFKQDPLIYGDAATTIDGSSETPNDYINVVLDVTGVDNGTVDDGNYVMQTATNGADGSRAQSYLGLLKVDKSRYTNTNQIPNLKIGFDALRISSDDNNSLQNYDTYYVLGTVDSYTATSLSEAPSGWTHFTSYTDTNSEKGVPFRETVTPSYNVSEIDGKYIHALNQGKAFYILAGNNYSTAGTSLLCSLTDKATLRDTVTQGYGLAEESYSEDSYSKFETELEDAATVLGDPSATQEEIDKAQKDLSDAMDTLVNVYYSLKYDNLFSAYEFSQHIGSMTANRANATVSYADGGSITVTNNDTDSDDVNTNNGYGTNYYNIAVTPETEYVFEYDVVTQHGSQLHLFMYDVADGNTYTSEDWLAPTSRSYEFTDSSTGKITAGTYQDNNGNNFMHYYADTSGHVVLKFKTPANADVITFRFGNHIEKTNASTFSNIKLVKADKYYADVDYEKTESVYKEYASYGTLPTLERTGYTFVCWKDEAEENVVTEANIATEHKTIYSQWNEHTYTITYNNNGGTSGSDNTSELIKYSDSKTLSKGNGFTKTGYKLIGWSKTSGTNSVDYELEETVSGLTAENGGNVILYAVWAKADINVTFDNLFDLSAWEIKPNSATISNETGTGFTITSTSGNDANTGWSGLIDVEPYETYIFSADTVFENAGGGAFDLYINTLDKDGAADTSSTVVAPSNVNIQSGQYITIASSVAEGNTYIKFTAGATTEYIKIRFDANNAGNVLTVKNIRVWEDDGVTLDTANKVVGNGNKYGDLPTPTKTGHTFTGWKNAANQYVTKDSVMDSDSTVNLYSQWTEITYTVNFSPNGPTDIATAEQQLPKYSEKIIMPDALSWEYGTFIGWSFNPTVSPYANDGSIYKPGAEVNVKDVIPDDGSTVIELHAVWQLTNVFEDDTVIADFGVMLPIMPEKNDCDTINYHISPKNPETGEGFGGVLELGFGSSVETKSYEGKYGTFEIYKDGDGKETRYVSYTPTKIVDAENVEDRVDTVTYCGRIKYLDGSYSELFTNTITVVPASNTLYEENVVKTTIETPATYQWNKKGSSTIAMQDFSTDEDIYGKDSAYATSTGFSDGTYLRADVTPDNKKSDTATFTFIGSGFDLISACGTNTGVQIVKVSVPDNESTTGYSAIRTFIVDTYFTDTNIMTDGLLHQVPIVNFRSDFGKYRVETTAAYLNSSGSVKAGNAIIAYSSASLDNGTVINTTIGEPSDEILNELEALGFEDLGDDVEVVWMDDNSVFNGGTGASRSLISGSAGLYFANEGTTTGLDNYIDGVRIYNPLDGGDGYYKDSEQNATYYNIVTELEMDSAQSNMAYIESGALNFIPKDESGNPLVDENGNPITFDFDAYNNQGGPKGEIYLKEGDAIAFKFTAKSNGTASSIMLGMRAIMGNPTIRTTVAGNASEPTTVNSRTEMYYQIATNVLVTTTGVTVIVTNPSDGDDETNNIVAVNNLKLINGPQSKSDSADNPVIMGNTSSGALAPTPVVPDAITGAEGNTESIPETDVDTDTDVPETDVEEETENNISVAIPGLPAPIASFLEMLFKLLGQLVGSLGF